MRINAHVNNLTFSTIYLQYDKKTFTHTKAGLIKHSARQHIQQKTYKEPQSPSDALNTTLPSHIFRHIQTENSRAGLYPALIGIH